jgi:AcrR family transcriptional regulator
MGRPRTDIAPRIVHAARARFLAEGVDGASLRAIAADAGTNIGMVVYYYPTKDDLFLAVVEEFYSKLLEDLGALLSAKAPVRERLRRAFARLGTMSEPERQIVRLVAREALSSSKRFTRILARAQRGHIAMIFEVLAEGVKVGDIDPDLPLPFVLICVFAMGGMPQVVRHAAGDRLPFAALPDSETLAQFAPRTVARTRRRDAQRRPAGPAARDR